MAASLIPVSHGEPMVFTKDAANAVWLFFLTNTADGSPATGKTIAGSDFRISKNGAAFANAAGVVTEISLGWYKMAWAAADLNTIGALACELSVEAGVDPIHCVHHVQALDVNVATVNPADGGLTAVKFAADALASISAALDAKVIKASLAGATGDASIGMKNAVDAVVEVTGTWGGGSVQMQTCEDPAAASPVWTNSGSALTADGKVTVAGPHAAVRAHMTGATAAALAVKFTIRKPVEL